MDDVATDIKFENDQTLMNQVLEPYFEHARYLKHAVVKNPNMPDQNERISALCKFSIQKSCYIEDTGHFNSVEFNICYNQMMYYTIAKIIKHGWMAKFKYWTLGDFFRKQLSDLLIVNFKSTFKAPIVSKNFTGEITIVNSKKIEVNRPLIYIKTLCCFNDNKNGYCEGEVDLAIYDD